MGLFGGQLSNVVEWDEFNEEMIFWKWKNDEIKKGSKLILRQGQDAIFMNNGKVEGIFKDDGSYDIESQIIPFLSTLKGFKFGFNSGMRAEVLFVNTKEMTMRWGTKNAVNIPAPGLPGGMPIRSFGTLNCKIGDYSVFIEKIAGVKDSYTLDDVKLRVTTVMDQLLMKWIVREGKDMFNLQANAFDIARGIQEDLDMELTKIGLSITGVNISSFSYPEEVQKMAEKAASQSMIGDMNRYQQVSMTDAMSKGGFSGGNAASDMVQMQMGMVMGQQMMNQMNMGQNQQTSAGQQPLPQGQQEVNGTAPKFCPNCGAKTEGAKFCSNCGNKLI